MPLHYVFQARKMQYWCPTPLPAGMEPRRKLRALEDWKAPPTDLLEGYLSNSSMEADRDTDPDTTVASASKPETAL